MCQLDDAAVAGASSDVDRRNAAFWDELCGSGLARSLGITARSGAALERFDDAYWSMYPYLARYVERGGPRAPVLEIGLGYGTLGQELATRDPDYHGLDIAEGPVEMMRHRLAMLGVPVEEAERRVRVGSVLEMPYPDASFGTVYTIGCLHHTGDLEGAVAEVFRVLAPGGRAVVMLYNRWSFRQLVQVARLRWELRGRHRREERAARLRGLYDHNAEGTEAPHTDYVSWWGARRLFSRFRRVRVDVQNFDPLILFGRRVHVPRERLLSNVARVLGLDLYIVAKK